MSWFSGTVVGIVMRQRGVVLISYSHLDLEAHNDFSAFLKAFRVRELNPGHLRDRQIY